MEQIKEAVYLINDERYLHLRENGAGVGFATYNKVTGEPLESGQISEKNLPPDGQNTIPAARNWYLFELSDDDRKAIQQESVKILENIPQAGIGRRRIWEPETLPKDIRLINSHYDDLYRIPDGGVIQVDYPDGRSFTARVEHLDDYHFDMGGLGNVFHICQFAEVMERNCADFYPEIQTQDEQAAWELGGKGYLAIQSCEDGWDYTIYHSDYSVMDGGQLDALELTIQEAVSRFWKRTTWKRDGGCCRTTMPSWMKLRKPRNCVQTTALPHWKSWQNWQAIRLHRNCLHILRRNCEVDDAAKMEPEF